MVVVDAALRAQEVLEVAAGEADGIAGGDGVLDVLAHDADDDRAGVVHSRTARVAVARVLGGVEREVQRDALGARLGVGNEGDVVKVGDLGAAVERAAAVAVGHGHAVVVQRALRGGGHGEGHVVEGDIGVVVVVFAAVAAGLRDLVHEVGEVGVLELDGLTGNTVVVDVVVLLVNGDGAAVGDVCRVRIGGGAGVGHHMEHALAVDKIVVIEVVGAGAGMGRVVDLGRPVGRGGRGVLSDNIVAGVAAGDLNGVAVSVAVGDRLGVLVGIGGADGGDGDLEGHIVGLVGGRVADAGGHSCAVLSGAERRTGTELKTAVRAADGVRGSVAISAVGDLRYSGDRLNRFIIEVADAGTVVQSSLGGGDKVAGVVGCRTAALDGSKCCFKNRAVHIDARLEGLAQVTDIDSDRSLRDAGDKLHSSLAVLTGGGRDLNGAGAAGEQIGDLCIGLLIFVAILDLELGLDALCSVDLVKGDGRVLHSDLIIAVNNGDRAAGYCRGLLLIRFIDLAGDGAEAAHGRARNVIDVLRSAGRNLVVVLIKPLVGDIAALADIVGRQREGTALENLFIRGGLARDGGGDGDGNVLHLNAELGFDGRARVVLGIGAGDGEGICVVAESDVEVRIARYAFFQFSSPLGALLAAVLIGDDLAGGVGAVQTAIALDVKAAGKCCVGCVALRVNHVHIRRIRRKFLGVSGTVGLRVRYGHRKRDLGIALAHTLDGDGIARYSTVKGGNCGVIADPGVSRLGRIDGILYGGGTLATERNACGRGGSR